MECPFRRSAKLEVFLQKWGTVSARGILCKQMLGSQARVTVCVMRRLLRHEIDLQAGHLGGTDNLRDLELADGRIWLLSGRPLT